MPSWSLVQLPDNLSLLADWNAPCAVVCLSRLNKKIGLHYPSRQKSAWDPDTAVFATLTFNDDGDRRVEHPPMFDSRLLDGSKQRKTGSHLD